MIKNIFRTFNVSELKLLVCFCPLLNSKTTIFECKPKPLYAKKFAHTQQTNRPEFSVSSVAETNQKTYSKFRKSQHKIQQCFLSTSRFKSNDLLGDFNEEKFKTCFQEATQDLRKGESLKEVEDAVIQLDKMISYNVFGGKMNRAMVVLGSFNLLAKQEQLTQEYQQKAVLLGWCVELLQACFLVADDIMDQSTLRRGKPCWYKIDGVGLAGFNDAFLLYSSIHSILRKNFKEERCYVHLVELFERVLQQTVVGQSLDLLTSSTDNSDLSRFTQERYDAIVKWKTGFYSFYMPTALALYLVGIYDEITHNQAKEILLKMGNFFQVQDDYLDCYGNPETIGKVGTDIEENKCSWLIVQALKLANMEQRQILESNYGYDDPKKVAVVKHVYNQLGIESEYKKFELASYKNIQRKIDEMRSDLPKQLFLEYAARIYKRTK